MEPPTKKTGCVGPSKNQLHGSPSPSCEEASVLACGTLQEQSWASPISLCMGSRCFHGAEAVEHA